MSNDSIKNSSLLLFISKTDKYPICVPCISRNAISALPGDHPGLSILQHQVRGAQREYHLQSDLSPQLQTKENQQ